MSAEIDYLLDTGPSGVLVHDVPTGASMLNKVREWLNTPQGSVWGDPRWGHRLEQFRHEAESTNMEVAIELSIVSKLPQDVDGALPQYIRAEFLDIDLVKVTIGVYDAELESEVEL